MHPLRHRMIEDLRLRGRAHNAIDANVRDVCKLVEWAGVPPAKLTAGNVRGFLVHLMDERHLSCSSHDAHVAAFKFFFGITLGRPDIVAFIPRRKVPMKLPTVLSQQQVAEFIDAASTRKHRAMLMTMYGAGLRVSELCKLEIPDINSQRMVIHVRDAKRGRERYAMLGPRLLETLREYFRVRRPSGPHLFPGYKPDACLTRAAVAKAVQTAARTAGPKMHVHPRSLRHAFATHLVEDGVDLRTVQVLLSHASMRSTMTYVHVTAARQRAIRSPLDALPRRDVTQTE